MAQISLCKVIGMRREPGMLAESGILGSGVRNSAHGIRNPSFTNKEYGIHSVESIIQDRFELPFMR